MTSGELDLFPERGVTRLPGLHWGRGCRGWITAKLRIRTARMLRNPGGLDPTAGVTDSRSGWETGLALRFREAATVGVPQP